MELIYRIEHSEKGGLYSSVVAREVMQEFEDSHPCPYEDPFIKHFEDEMDYYFGFRSMDDLKRWVHEPEWVAALYEEGFELLVFEAEGVCHGCRQSIFLKDKSKLVERKSILSAL